MPINNNYFGVWKFAVLGNQVYIVDSLIQEVKQDIQPKYYVQGQAVARILEIGGAQASVKIRAPLLIGPAARTVYVNNTPYVDSIYDGLHIWNDFFNDNYLNGSFSADPFFIMQQARFSVSSDRGASYEITFIGDYDALNGETINPGAEFGIVNPYTDAYPGDPPLPAGSGQNIRVAAFYDIYAQVGIGEQSVTAPVQELTIDVEAKTEPFNFVGQKSQRKIFGIGGFMVKFSGTFISESSFPKAWQFPLQATGNIVNPDTSQYWGGTAKATTGGFSVSLRDGTNNVGTIPILTNIPWDKAVFSGSSLEIGNGLQKSKFDGMVWISSNTDFTTAPVYPPANTDNY